MQEAKDLLSLPTSLLMQIALLLDDNSKLNLRIVCKRLKRIAELRGSWDGSFKTEEVINIKSIIEGILTRQLSNGKLKSEKYLETIDKISKADQSLISNRDSLKVVANNIRTNLVLWNTYNGNKEIQSTKTAQIVIFVWWGLIALMAIFLPPSPVEIAFQCTKMERACRSNINDSLIKLLFSRVASGFAVGHFLKVLDALLAEKIFPTKLSTDLPTLNHLEDERNTKTSLSKIAWKVYNARDFIAFSLAIILFCTLTNVQIFIRDDNCENASEGFRRCLAARLNESDKTPEIVCFISSALLAFSYIAVLAEINFKKISKNIFGFFKNDNVPKADRLPLLDPADDNNFLKFD